MTPTTATPWQSVLNRLSSVLDDHTITHWINHVVFLSYEDGRLILEAPNDFIRNTIVERYRKQLTKACQECLPDFVSFEIQTNPKIVEPAQDIKSSRQTTKLGKVSGSEHPTDKEGSTAGEAPKQRGRIIDRFVVGPENKVASAVAESIAEGLRHKPEWRVVFLYGACGIGKSHLLWSIAEAASKIDGYRYILRGSEALVNEMIVAIKNKATEEFRHKYRSLRLLIVDDLDFLFEGNKTACCSEFLFIMEAIIERGGCVVLCANKSPKEMRSDNYKLLSLLSSGLSIQMKAPGPETLSKIISCKASSRGISLNEAQTAEIAERCSRIRDGATCGDVREVVGILNNLKLLSRLERKPVDDGMLEEACRHAGIKLPTRVTVQRIMEAVARHFHIDLKTLNGQNRTRRFTYPRQVAMSLCHELLPDMSIKEIAKAFGRDHTTVIYACERINGDLASSHDLEAIRASLTST